VRAVIRDFICYRYHFWFLSPHNRAQPQNVQLGSCLHWIFHLSLKVPAKTTCFSQFSTCVSAVHPSKGFGQLTWSSFWNIQVWFAVVGLGPPQALYQRSPHLRHENVIVSIWAGCFDTPRTQQLKRFYGIVSTIGT